MAAVGPPVLRLSGVSKTYAADGSRPVDPGLARRQPGGWSWRIRLAGRSQRLRQEHAAGTDRRPGGADLRRHRESRRRRTARPGRWPTCRSAICCCPGARCWTTPRWAPRSAAATAPRRASARSRSCHPSVLKGFADALPHTLSGGMRQRAALLRTVLLDRPILLLDEPFGALDALTRAALQEWLLEIWERLEAAVLFVTHDVEEALWLSDRVYVMTRRPGSHPARSAGWSCPGPGRGMCVARWSSRRSSNACWTHCWLTLLSFKLASWPAPGPTEAEPWNPTR